MCWWAWSSVMACSQAVYGQIPLGSGPNAAQHFTLVSSEFWLEYVETTESAQCDSVVHLADLFLTYLFHSLINTDVNYVPYVKFTFIILYFYLGLHPQCNSRCRRSINITLARDVTLLCCITWIGCVLICLHHPIVALEILVFGCSKVKGEHVSAILGRREGSRWPV